MPGLAGPEGFHHKRADVLQHPASAACCLYSLALLHSKIADTPQALRSSKHYHRGNARGPTLVSHHLEPSPPSLKFKVYMFCWASFPADNRQSSHLCLTHAGPMSETYNAHTLSSKIRTERFKRVQLPGLHLARTLKALLTCKRQHEASMRTAKCSEEAKERRLQKSGPVSRHCCNL